MNELSLRQRLGDGADPTVMSLQRQGEERELYETSHSFFRLPLSAVPTPGALVSCDGLILQAGDSSPPLTHPRCSLAIFPSPALPCPALPVSALWTLAQVAKIPISRPRSGAQAKTPANLVCVCLCVCVCVWVCVCVCVCIFIFLSVYKTLRLRLGWGSVTRAGQRGCTARRRESPGGEISSSHSAACPLLISWREGSG